MYAGTRIIVSVSLLLVLSLSAYASEQAQSIHWINSYNKALSEAKQSGKPILLSFRCVP